MWLFCLLDLFMPTQIKFLATPLTTVLFSENLCQIKTRLRSVYRLCYSRRMFNVVVGCYRPVRHELNSAGGGSVSVHSISTVLRGSQFGPFNCHVVDRLNQTSSPGDDCSSAAGTSDECRLEASFLLPLPT